MLRVVNSEIEIHETPLEKVVVDFPELSIYFDDINENRWKIVFKPFQGVKLTTIDCFGVNSLLIDGVYKKFILEDTESKWIQTLKQELKLNDDTADFMKKSHHYIFPFQDNIIEVAWGNYVIALDK